MTAPKPSAHQIRAIAVSAVADPRTVASYLRGDRRVQAMTRERLDKALRELGLEHLKSNAGSGSPSEPGEGAK